MAMGMASRSGHSQQRVCGSARSSSSSSTSGGLLQRAATAPRRCRLPCARVLCSSNGNGSKSAPVVLEVKDLEAKIAATGQQILKGVNLTIREGEVHAIMGKNGSGKSTLSKVLVGHPDYEVTGGSAVFKGRDLFALEPEERAHAGLFLSFQSPIEIPGVSNVDFLRMAYNARRKAAGEPELDPLEFYAHVVPKVCWACRVRLRVRAAD
jgi:Fe-S cluster assembly ATP-binding protein